MIPIWGKAGGSGGGGGGGIALVAHTSLTPAANNGGTTGAIVTTGANLICVTVSSYVGAPATLSDNKGNTYGLDRTKNDGASSSQLKLYHCLSPIVGSGHTFTLAGVGCYGTMAAEAFSGVNVAFGLDQNSAGGSSVASPVQPGTITPGASGSLVYTGATVSAGPLSPQVWGIDSGMIISDQVPFSTGVYFGCMGAYLIQTPAAAINPSISYPGAVVTGMAAGSISFRAA